jgi:ABC-2 type transport system permease protein
MRIIWANIMAIFRRELQSYFLSPLALVIAGIFWLLSGFFFVTILLGPEGVLAQAALRDQMGAGNAPPVDIPYEFIRGFLGLQASLALFILPILSMGLYAEERKRGTLELLATSPITNWAVAVGKLLAVTAFFTVLTLPLIVYEAIVVSNSNPAFPPTLLLIGHLGLVLLAASVLSVGMFISSLTDSTILAAILTFASILFLWVIDAVGKGISGPIGNAIGHLSLLAHYNNLTQGVVDLSSFVLFFSYIGLGIFLTAQAIEVLRFQRT